jgi:hypothetical protein
MLKLLLSISAFNSTSRGIYLRHPLGRFISSRGVMAKIKQQLKLNVSVSV